jgi:hypothetical protein
MLRGESLTDEGLDDQVGPPEPPSRRGAAGTTLRRAHDTCLVTPPLGEDPPLGDDSDGEAAPST